MKLAFTKMQGCGNDYIYINAFDAETKNVIAQCDIEALAIEVSNRHMSIGSDGLVIIEPSSIADARMRMFNLDGSEGEMCGNAIRCVTKFLYDQGIVGKQTMEIETKSGMKQVHAMVENKYVVSAQVCMGKPIIIPSAIPVKLSGDCVINYPLSVEGQVYDITCVSMGNPHAIVVCDDVEAIDLHRIGPLIEHHPIFLNKTNVEFIEIQHEQEIKMRVWERGSGETLACGTGACASVVAACLLQHCVMNEEVCVHLRGGDLNIRYTSDDVYMRGPCVHVFDGCIDINERLMKGERHEG